MKKRLTIEEIRRRAAELSGCEVLSEEYRNNREPLLFRCRCGAEFWKSWNEFQDQGHNLCNACAKQEQYDAKRLDENRVRARLEQYGYEWISGEYKNQKSKLTVRCSCGHLRTATFTNLVDQTHSGLCVSCTRSESQRLSIFSVELFCAMNDLECLDDSYVDAHTPMRFRCHCGREFRAAWNNVSSGRQRQCAVCSKYVSKGELAVKTWLDAHGFVYEMQKRFQDCGGVRPYPFDFFLPTENLCIEFDGEQHFRAVAFGGTEDHFVEQKARDAAKDAYCERKGLRLLRVPYSEISNVDDILSATLIPR